MPPRRAEPRSPANSSSHRTSLDHARRPRSIRLLAPRVSGFRSAEHVDQRQAGASEKRSSKRLASVRSSTGPCATIGLRQTSAKVMRLKMLDAQTSPMIDTFACKAADTSLTPIIQSNTSSLLVRLVEYFWGYTEKFGEADVSSVRNIL